MKPICEMKAHPLIVYEVGMMPALGFNYSGGEEPDKWAHAIRLGKTFLCDDVESEDSGGVKFVLLEEGLYTKAKDLYDRFSKFHQERCWECGQEPPEKCKDRLWIRFGHPLYKESSQLYSLCDDGETIWPS